MAQQYIMYCKCWTCREDRF